MPVRSLNSRVFTWPNAETVRAAVERWALAVYAADPNILRLGYFGSYARGDWGVGSDVDLIAIVLRSELSFERRSNMLPAPNLPVPADLLIYTAEEWDAMRQEGRFGQTVEREAVWIDRL